MNQENKQQEKKSEEGKQYPRTGRPQWSWWPLIILVILWIYLLQIDPYPVNTIPYTAFKTQLKQGNVEYLEAEGETLQGEFKKEVPLFQLQRHTRRADQESTTQETEGQRFVPDEEIEEASPSEPQEPTMVSRFETTMPPFGDENLTDEILAQDVEFVSKGSGENTFWMVVLNLLPFLLLVGIGILILRNISSQAKGMMSVGRSKAKKFEKEHTSIKFDDVAGVEEAKQGLKEIIDFLTKPEQFQRLGCRVPKGVLLVGPPGTGKTLLARAVAGEAEVPFYSITGSDFMEMFVGVGASRVRDLFQTAKQNTPCIIFMDELDSVGRHRGAGLGGGHDEREQTLNQLLSEIDGFEPTDNLVVIGSTNRPDILDPALLRPGRFDRRVVIDLPSLTERTAILKVHAKKVPLADDVDLEDLARSMPGRSGADLANLVNEAALLAARRNKNKVDKEDFSEARDKILMGQTRGGVILSSEEKKTIAIHEAGHAMVAHLSPEADPVEKISIIPRGRALGATQQLPEERYNLTKEYLYARLKVMLGGRASEELFVGTVSTGAANDLMQATRLARRMIGQWGMGENFQNVAFDDENAEVFLGEQLAKQRSYSEDTAREIDIEVKNLIDEAFREARQILEDNSERLKSLSEVLETDETLEGDKLKRYLDGEVTSKTMDDSHS